MEELLLVLCHPASHQLHHGTGDYVGDGGRRNPDPRLSGCAQGNRLRPPDSGARRPGYLRLPPPRAAAAAGGYPWRGLEGLVGLLLLPGPDGELAAPKSGLLAS